MKFEFGKKIKVQDTYAMISCYVRRQSSLTNILFWYSQGVSSDKVDKSVQVFFMIDFYSLNDAKNDGVSNESQKFEQFEISAPF